MKINRRYRRFLEAFDREIIRISDECYKNMPGPTVLDQPYVDPVIEAMNMRIDNNRIMTSRSIL